MLLVKLKLPIQIRLFFLSSPNPRNLSSHCSEDEPLRDYKNEDVLVKLPVGWKTFDIDFVSVFNPADRTSYGHAAIPPVVVPPCEDVFSP